jgi:hypothetical protein
MCLGYGDWPAALYATEDDFHLLITSGNGAREPWGRRRACGTAHQIPNEFRIAYSAGGNRVGLPALSGSGAVLSLRCATDHFIPAR